MSALEVRTRKTKPRPDSCAVMEVDAVSAEPMLCVGYAVAQEK